MALTAGRRLRLESDGLVHYRGLFEAPTRKGGVTKCGVMYTIEFEPEQRRWHDAATLVEEPLTCLACLC